MTKPDEDPRRTAFSGDSVAGAVLAGASVLSVVFMARHPSVQSSAIADVVAEIVREAATDAWVHGGLIALMGLLVFGLFGLSQRLELRRPMVRLAAVAYAMGAVAYFDAAMVSGFVVPRLAARYSTKPAEDLDALRHLLGLTHDVNQALANAGVVATSAALVGWSIAMLRRPGGPRLLGGFGAVLGAVTTAAIFAGRLPLHVHGMGLVVLTQALWTTAAGVQLARGRI
jgi:hypothetical protein